MKRRKFLNLAASAAGAAATGRIAAALPPAIPIIDTHIHLFDPGRPGGVPWPAKTDTALYKAALPDRYAGLARHFGVVGAIVVDAGLNMRVTNRGQLREENVGSPLLPWTSQPWHVAQESVLTTCAHMLAAVRSGRDADTSGAENLRSFALVEAAYEAAATGRAVVPRGHRA